MIHVVPNLGKSMALHEGHLTPSYSGPPGSDWIYIKKVRVPIQDLQEWYSETMSFTWKGHQFILLQYELGIVSGSTEGIDPLWAHENGLDGDPYSGWYGKFPEEEVENVQIKHNDLLAAWKHQREMGAPPPYGHYITLRSAKSEE